MKWLPILQPWLDPKYQLITQPPPGYDGGDAAQREGSFMFLSFMLYNLELMDDNEFFAIQDRYSKIADLLNDPNHPGFLRRFPDPSYWGSLSDRFSRDQSIPSVMGMSFLATKAQRDPSKHLQKFFKNHLKRALLFTTNTRENAVMPGPNPLTTFQKVKYVFGWRPSTPVYAWAPPDITVLGFWSIYIRAFRAWPMYPLMLVFDLDFVVTALTKVLSYAKDPTNNDDINFINCLLQSEISMPTPWSKLAKWIYKKRPYPQMLPGQTASNAAQACLIAYFRGSNPGPKLEEIYAPVTKHYFG